MTAVDMTGFNRQIAKLAALTKQPVRVIVTEEAMRFTRQLIKFTPPAVNKATAGALKANNPTFKNATVKRIGQMAIRRDINAIVQGAQRGFIERAIDFNGGNPDMINREFRNKKGEIYLIDWGFARLSITDIPQFHKANRDRRGRVSRSTSKRNTVDIGRWTARNKMIVPDEVKKEYTNRMFKRIGYMKAGWLKSWNKLNAAKGWRAAPKMISRHAGYAKGGGHVQRTRNGIVITLQNSTPGIKVLENAVHGAVRARTQAMGRRVKKLIKLRK